MIALIVLIVGITHVFGYYLYYLTVKDGVKPNTTSWSIWTFGSLINLFSYSELTGDWYKNVLPIACSVSCIILYIALFYKGKFRKLNAINYVTILIDIIATLLWFITDSALIGNIALQVSTIISFAPIIREIYDEDENEKPLPWLLWSIAYSLDLVVIFFRWEKWGDVVYPAVCFILHFLVWMLIVQYKKERLFANKKNYKYIKKSFKRKYEIEDYLYVKNSVVSGKGLYVKKEFKKDELIFTMKGPLLEFYPKNEIESLEFPNIVGLKENLFIDPVEPYEFINHSCEPNVLAGSDGLNYYALKNIEKNEEIMFDYSTSEDTLWKMSCSCGSKRCRKIIKSIEFLPKKIFEGYLPYIPEYFRKKYIQTHVEL